MGRSVSGAARKCYVASLLHSKQTPQKAQIQSGSLPPIRTAAEGGGQAEGELSLGLPGGQAGAGEGTAY